MKLNYPAVRTSHQNAYSPLDRRYAERVPIGHRVSYSGTEGARNVTGEGILKDLSKTGCKILGSTMSSLGSNLTLHLYLEDGLAPLCLTSVTISWIERASFSVRFPNLSAEERKRIQEVVWKHVRLSSLDNRRTAFRII
ncbi:MAG: PilZ domain-containing protein [Nitrospirota bacterium]|nr:PilZ domain-containing protein [Nitrospirota bacterium]MDP2383135.1 PilZ domain-containing protein [Nitrospirota bacterium]MDP3598253.1 PilZ domain-containing protein [Nitrospirota bacterium]